MTRKILVLLTVIIVLSSLVIPAYAASYTIPVSGDPVTVNPGEDNQLLFTYDGSSVKWSTFSDNPNFTLFITNSIGKANYRVLVNNVYSTSFSTTNLSDTKIGTFGVAINWNFIEANLSSVIPEDLSQSFVVVAGSGNTRNIYFYVDNKSDTETEDGSVTLPDDSDGDKKKWYDYLLDGIKSYFESLMDYIKDLFYFPDAIESLKNLLSSFNVFIERFSSVTIQPFVDFVDNLNNGVLNYIGKIWEFPIVKDLTYGLVIIALVGGLFKLFITL